MVVCVEEIRVLRADVNVEICEKQKRCVRRWHVSYGLAEGSPEDTGFGHGVGGSNMWGVSTSDTESQPRCFYIQDQVFTAPRYDLDVVLVYYRGRSLRVPTLFGINPYFDVLVVLHNRKRGRQYVCIARD